jgi:poly [ADP-ribose] polymerase
MLFDVNVMKACMREMEIDMSKMPLGKLSRAHMESAFGVLTELQKILKNDALDAAARVCYKSSDSKKLKMF